MQAELDILELILNASVLVQSVMLILLIASIASWMVIFKKRSMLNRATENAEEFEESFWSGSELSRLYDGLVRGDRAHSGLERVFESGYKEFTRMRERKVSAEAVVAAAQRGMRVAATREMDRLEHHLSFLATVGSTSPYVGLFGTVWGIMTSFRALGAAQQATIAMVAPGISEALIATAMGLFAAIPAVIAYNRFSNQVERLAVRYENFTEEFTAILERQSHHQEG